MVELCNPRATPRLKTSTLCRRLGDCSGIRRSPFRVKLRHSCSNGPCPLWPQFRKWVGLAAPGDRSSAREHDA
jgi:hypothetical protein